VQRAPRGTPLVIHGYLKQDEWQERDTGKRRSTIKVIARQVGVLPQRPQGEGGGGAAAGADGPGFVASSGASGGGAAEAAAEGDGYQQAAGGAFQQQQEQQQEQQEHVPLPAAPANDLEALWLSVIQNPDAWYDNRQVRRFCQWGCGGAVIRGGELCALLQTLRAHASQPACQSPHATTASTQQDKRNPRAPDFKRKGDGRALWVSSSQTPAWALSNLPPLHA